MYKIDGNILLSYVMHIFPNKRVNASNYTTRNAQNYSIPKCWLLDEMFHILDLNIVNTHVLLWGDSAIRDNENKHLFTLVYDYIKNSERFNWY